MANANTSLNGYEFGRSPKTQAPFWGGSSEGAEIDDTAVVTDKTWSSKKISDELAEKADSDDVYTKAQVDELLSEIPSVDAYTKTETDELLASKASVTSVYTKTQTYTKTEVDNLISQIPAVDAYTKAQTDSLLADKANAADVYTKSQVDNLIPDVSGLATKTELNSGLATKANTDDVYTKTYLDSEFEGISHAFSDVRDQIDTCAKATSVYTKAQTYTKAEVDDLIAGATPAPVDAYTKAQTDNLLAAKADKTELADYAKVTSVYTKTQTYTKAEVDDLIAGVPTVDAYTKAQTDTLLADKANAADVYTKTQTDNLLADKADVTDLAGYATATSVYTKSQTYTKTEVDNLISQAGGGLDADSLITFKDTHGLFRYSTNYGATQEFVSGTLYNITGTVNFYVDGTQVYNGGLENIPYNDLASGASQDNILGSGKYLWRDWVIPFTNSTGTYVEIPVKIAYIGRSYSYSKYNPYIHIIYPADCGHTITFGCYATNYTAVSSSDKGYELAQRLLGVFSNYDIYTGYLLDAKLGITIGASTVGTTITDGLPFSHILDYDSPYKLSGLGDNDLKIVPIGTKYDSTTYQNVNVNLYVYKTGTYSTSGSGVVDYVAQLNKILNKVVNGDPDGTEEFFKAEQEPLYGVDFYNGSSWISRRFTQTDSGGVQYTEDVGEYEMYTSAGTTYALKVNAIGWKSDLASGKIYVKRGTSTEWVDVNISDIKTRYSETNYDIAVNLISNVYNVKAKQYPNYLTWNSAFSAMLEWYS